jgi:hypothetical protein
MKAYEFIKSKQIQWALNHGIALIGSKGDHGLPSYTSELNQNLFEPMGPEVRCMFENGDGNELDGNPNNPAKMQAVHSSSALGVNVFHYWRRIGQVPIIAAACGFCEKGNLISQSIVFEDKYPIDNNLRPPPNIDVVIHNTDSSKFKLFAIECKFTEAYDPRKQKGIKEKYFQIPTIWTGLSHLLELAQSISPLDKKFIHLDAAQLIKHILGLSYKHPDKDNFKLLYLWHDAFGEEGATHRSEVEAFSKVAKNDGIHFLSMTYQELIATLSNHYRQENKEYISYLTERYL